MADDIVLKVDVDTGDADKELKDLNKNLDKTGKNAKTVGKEAKGGFSGMIKGVKGVGMALKTAGIGIFLAALAGLFALLKENQAVMDFFNKATRTMGILFSKLTDALIPVKDALMSAFEDPKQAVIDLWEVIKENMVNRVTGMIDFFKQSFSGLINTIQGSALAIKGIFSDEAKEKSKEFFAAAKKDALAAGESFLQMSTGIDDLPNKLKKGFEALKEVVTDAVDGADKYVKKQNELLLAEAQLTKFIAGNRLELEKLKTTREDETKSIEERISASDEMMVLIKEEEDRAIKLQEEKIALMKLDKDQTQTTIEDLAEIAKAEAALDDLRTKAVVSNLENLKFANTLRKQESDASKLAKDTEIERMKEFRDRKKGLEDEWKLEDSETDAEYYENLQELELERYETELENDLLKQEEKEFLLKEHLRNKQDIQDEADKIAADQARAKLKFEQGIENSKLDIAKQGLQLIQSIAAEGSDIQKAALVAEKAIAIAQIIKNTMVANSLALTAPPLGLGPIAGQALVGINIASAAVGVATVLAQTAMALGAFEKGGVLVGPSHAQGGIITPFGELEGGEGVINNMSMATPSLRNLASAANTGGGGNDFSTGDGSIKLSAESISMIVNGINDKKVIVSETDITSTQERVSVIEAEAVL